MRAIASRGRRVRWRRARGWDGWVGLVTSHDSWFVVCAASTAHARARVHATRRRRATNDARRATRDERRWNAFARGTDGRTGRTMTDGRSRRGSFHSFTSSRDDSIHAFILMPFATRARGVCPSMHRCERARLARRIFFHGACAHRSVERDVARVERSSSQRRASSHSRIRMNE